MITKKFRLLTFALIFSGVLNVALLAAFAFSMAQEAPVFQTISRAPKKVQQSSNGQLVGSMSALSFRELVSFLTNRDLVEEGYAKRDLAVAALVAYHHFNLEKALCDPPMQVRTLVAGEKTIDLFPGLTEEQFEAIIRFAYQEKWPLTAKGLFVRLQSEQIRDESLEQAFFITSEFGSLKLLFQKSSATQENSLLLALVREGNWEILQRLSLEQAQTLDFSAEKRREVLLSYLACRSPTAAQLLLTTDFTFALKKLEDGTVMDLLAISKQQSEAGTKFCLELLKSARSDAVHASAAATLYAYAGELPAAPIDPKLALARFGGEMSVLVEKPTQALAVTPSLFHVVKEGESLWKISRQYKVKVDELVRVNELEKDSLYPGMTLKIP